MKNYVNWVCPACWWEAYSENDEFSCDLIFKCDECDLEMTEDEFPDSHK